MPFYVFLVFTARCTCDFGGSGPHRLEILETNCTDNYPNTLALLSPKAIHILPGKHGEEVGCEKVACWSTKAALSLKHIKIEESYYGGSIGTHQCSFERCHPQPTASSSQDWVFATPTQNCNRYYLGNG